MEIKRGLRIPVYGLGCGGDGVLRAYVNPTTETAYVDYDPAETDVWVLVLAVERAGYQAGRPVEA